ncbi:L2 capsid protein [Bos taurus papillomavirus 13]|uniref:Minor capsid protein L2 n=1 Tax=Bos taurus papillomavirus 13 TaxID=1887213 RepID=A0A1B2K1Y7_BPV1|nr:L2 capsid protein [Bos taurus papillomavirus 13]ANZ90230.1 L2 capsid protein [Bos taurus papillomavirus 13]AXE75100.1 L2 [Bos taurus papillomavirus 13]
MSARKRVRRANVYDLYRTCKQAGTCPPDVIPKVEGDTIADKILKLGGLAIYLGGLGIGTWSTGRVAAGGSPRYVPLRTSGSTSSLASAGSRAGAAAGTRSSITTGIPLDTLETIGAFRPGAYEDTVLPEAPAIVTPDAVPADTGIDGLSIGTDSSTETLVTLLEPEGPDDIAVLELQPLDHPNWQVSNAVHQSSAYHAPLQLQSSIAETSGLENIFVGGAGLGDTGGEEIELTYFGSPRTSTPRSFPTSARGILNWFSKRYYTQIPTEDPDIFTSQTFANPVYDPEPVVLKGPSGRVGLSQVYRPDYIETRGGGQVGPQLHVRYSLSTITEDVEAIPLAGDEDTQGLAFIPVHEEHGDFEEIELDDFSEQQSLLPRRASATNPVGSGVRRSIIPGQSFSATRPTGVVTYGSPDMYPASPVGPDSTYPSLVIDDNSTTPIIIIDGHTIDFYSNNYSLHPSLLRKRKKRKHA